jgi:hypothetical protein
MKALAARSCAVASVCALALAAWLYLPSSSRTRDRASPPLRVCVFDASRSASSRNTDGEAWLSAALLDQAARAREAHEELCVIGFGSEVKRVFGPGSADAFLALSRAASPARVPGLGMRGDESRLKAALDLVLEILERRGFPPARLELIVDGTYTGADPGPDLVRLHGAGVATRWVQFPPADRPDLALAGLLVPERIEAGAPLSIGCDIRLRPGAGSFASLAARLQVRCARPSGVLEREIVLEAPLGAVPDEDGYVGWRVRCDLERAEPGRTRIEAAVEARGDALPEDDAAAATLVCGDELVVGYVGAEDGEDAVPAWLRKIASRGGLEIVPVASASLDRELSSLDVLVTGDVACQRLPAELVAAFVERGGGWLSLAGFRSWRSFLQPIAPSAARASDPERARGEKLRSLLPLQPLDEDSPARDVLFLIDGSGSMVGEPFDRARAAVGSLFPLADPRDDLGVCLFGAELGATLPLASASAAQDAAARWNAAESALAGLSAPGGPTGLLHSLEELADRRTGSPRAALVWLFSDGRDISDPHPEARCREISQRLARTRTKLFVAAVGDDPDRELLAALVPDGQRLLEVRSLADPRSLRELGDLFQREIGSDRLRVEDAAAVVPARELERKSSALGAQILAAELAAVPGMWPTIQRYVLARAAPPAEVLWQSRSGEPLLGVQRVGAGAAAACAFAIPAWAPLWSERDDLLGPLVRALGRGKRVRAPALTVNGGELALDGLGPDAPPLLEAWLFEDGAAGDDAPRARLLLGPPVSGEDPRARRTGTLPAAAALDGGARVLRVEVRRAAGTAGEAPLFVLPLVLERAPEFRFPRSRVRPGETSERDAEQGAAPRIDASMKDSVDRAPHPAATPVLAVGLVLLCLSAILGFFGRRGR